MQLQCSLSSPRNSAIQFSFHPNHSSSPLCNSCRNIGSGVKGGKCFASVRASSCLTSPSTAASSISSPSNPFIKHCVKLRQSSSYRHLHGSVLVVGLTPIREILMFLKLQKEKLAILDCLLLLDGVEVPQVLHDSFVRIVHVSSIVMKKLSGVQSIDCIEAVALMKIPSSFCSLDDNEEKANCQSWFSSPHRILVLDGIQDPGNLGSLLRSAVAFRWDGVFMLPGCCDPFNEKALRAARGASFQLPIVSGNWVHLEALSKNFQMKMLAGHAENTEEEKLTSVLSHELVDSLADEHICLVLGSEGHGLSVKSKAACKLVSIPMEGEVESLNVSVAGGIFLFMLCANNRSI